MDLLLPVFFLTFVSAMLAFLYGLYLSDKMIITVSLTVTITTLFFAIIFAIETPYQKGYDKAIMEKYKNELSDN